jgi:UDP-N-acetylglucosamine--N-acetylmuramyl-(pentapeptide) pyrophosphoryl-undecaprenol N-acetylglucosamine transferase
MLGTARGLERTLIAERYPLALIPPVPLPRTLTPALLTVPVRLARATRAAGQVLNERAAQVVAGFGGYAALPAYLAARRRRLPLIVHEANARPGLANRIGARLAVRVLTATPAARLPGAEVIGMPLRSAVADLDRGAVRAAARRELGLDPQAPTLLVFGGSQGARRLNQAMAAAGPTLIAAGLQVLHLTGAAHAAELSAQLAGPRYLVRPYLDRMELGYAAADLALCRAGALTCAELAAVGLPAIYVPLPIGNGEQTLNAEPVVAAGGGMLVADRLLDGAWITREVPALLAAPDRLAAMAAAAKRFGVRDADDRLAEIILGLLG